jgi:fructokinase
VIVVAGEALVDLIVHPDGRVVPVAGGGPYNSARAIARLGVPCAWIGGLSTDRFGQMLAAHLAADGVSVALAQRSDRPTTLALAELDEQGAASYRFYVEGTSAPALEAAPLAGGLPAGTRALHAGTLGFVLEPMATTLEQLVALIPDDMILMVDPNCRPSITADPEAYRARLGRVLARADVIKVSAEDLAYLHPGVPLADALAWLVGDGRRVVLLTDGGRSVSVHVAGTAHVVPVPPVHVVDTVGAGDTFGGAFLACIVHDGLGRRDLGNAEAVLRATGFGVRASGMACERAGADPPTLAELGGWPPTGR